MLMRLIHAVFNVISSMSRGRSTDGLLETFLFRKVLVSISGGATGAENNILSPTLLQLFGSTLFATRSGLPYCRQRAGNAGYG